ncbi:hypothetical protein Tco_1491496 [Tanacetum coccineum]
MAESAKRHEENSNIIKEIQASTDAAIRNQAASIKTLEIQIGQMSKVLQERGFGSLPSSIETNLRDQRGTRCGRNLILYDDILAIKRKDPGSFTLHCFIHNICFDKALVDLGASVSIMPFSTYTNLGLGILSHTRLTIVFIYDIQDLNTYNEYEQELNNDEAKRTDEPWLENGVPYQLCDHICKPYRFKNGRTQWPTCTSDIDGFYNGGELPGMVQVGSMTYFQDHRWYDELADRKLKNETLALKSKIEGSWGDATPGVLKFCKWLKSCFENFHKIEYKVLVKLQECWWKVNTYEIAPFTRMENYGRGSYANIKIEWTNNPYLDINRIFGRDYEASNVSCTQENQKDNRIPEPSNCKVRRFEMMKYSFNDDEEYITIKESEYLNHSKDSLDASQELLRLIDDGWVVTTPDNE